MIFSMIDSKKLFLWPVVISLVGHVLLIAVSSLVDLRTHVKPPQFMTVRIAQSLPTPEPKKEEKKIEEKKPVKPQDPKALLPDSGGREDTVDLGSSDIKYAAYLAPVKKRIMRVWVTSAVYRKHDKGDVVILMSVNADGSLAQVSVTTSSGQAEVDAGTLDAIKAAAPFQPLPAQYDLSRLHITALFQYRASQ